jgi:hypothetical protein
VGGGAGGWDFALREEKTGWERAFQQVLRKNTS